MRLLHQLARLHGIELSYFDIIARQERAASPESLLAVLLALGAPVEKLADVPAAWRERRQALWRRRSPPVAVARRGRLSLELRLPAGEADGTLACHLQLENGEIQRWTTQLSTLAAGRAAQIEGLGYFAKRLSFPQPLPDGYHRLSVELGGQRDDVLLLAPPSAGAFTPGRKASSRTWGVFLPLHALRTRRDWGSGNFSDLETLMDWVSNLGGGVVATLPLLAAFLDQPCEPSPYSPASRLFWNELFLDVGRIPELAQSPTARQLLASADFEQERTALEAAPLVEYRGAMALKRRVLEELARSLFSSASERRTALERYLAAHPALDDYARFRAVVERRRAPWPDWPERLRNGALESGDYEEAAHCYHLYVQWLAHQQLEEFSHRAREKGLGLYLDLPLGVHPAGYDVWRERALFPPGVTGGAPPDDFFTRGQNWGFPPLHPERIREQGYRYFIACLRHHLRYASLLRIDHVMSLHRLFWIPSGMKAVEGVYVHYHPKEFYAILALESQRHRALLLGEDLGTVPPYVRPAMARHKIHRSYVVQFEVAPDPAQALPSPRPDSVASLNTHDTPTLAGYWEGLDLEDIEAGELAAEHQKREARKHGLVQFLEQHGRLTSGTRELAAIAKGCLTYLAASSARVVTVNLEDLWEESLPQNVPGTGSERPNWRRKARYRLEEFCQLPQVLDTLRAVDAERRARPKTK